MGEDLHDGLGVGKERDEGGRFLGGGTDQREDLLDPSQKSGQPGWSGGDGIRCPHLCPFWLEDRSRGGCRQRKRGSGSLGGEGIVFLGPGRERVLATAPHVGYCQGPIRAADPESGVPLVSRFAGGRINGTVEGTRPVVSRIDCPQCLQAKGGAVRVPFSKVLFL